MRRIASVTFVFLAVTVSSLFAADPTPVAPEKLPGLDQPEEVLEAYRGMPVILRADFEEGRADRFRPTDPAAWKVVKQKDNHIYALTVRKSDYQPPQRSPHNISLIEGIDVGNVALDVRFQSAMTDYGHRSLCLFFNYVDPSHFYYVHFGKEADPHANQIFIVNGADRKAISETTTDGTPWDDEWHHGRVVRNADTGRIEVFFDDMTKPIMTATDKTFSSGQVGIGSFDDAGNFDAVVVYSNQAPKTGSKTNSEKSE